MKKISLLVFMVFTVYSSACAQIQAQKDTSKTSYGLSLIYERSIVPLYNESLFGVGLKVKFNSVSIGYNLFAGSNTTFSEPIFKTSFGIYAAFHVIGAGADARANGDTSLAEYFEYAAIVLMIIPQTLSINIPLNDKLGMELNFDLFPIEISRSKTSSYIGVGAGFPFEISNGNFIVPYFGLKTYVTDTKSGFYLGVRLDLTGSGKE